MISALPASRLPFSIEAHGQSLKLFFVCGAQKSGTTWLQRLLDAHPQIVCSGEGHFIERLARPMMQLQEAYNKQLGIVAESVYENRPYYPPATPDEMKANARTMILKFMQRRLTPETMALGDKTPRYTEFLEELRELFPRASFIHIVRDPRDVVVSLLHHGRRSGFRDALDPGTDHYRNGVTGAARAWLKAQANVATFVKRHGPGIVHELSYENLVSDPVETARKVFRFLSVQEDDETVGAAVGASSFEAVSGRKPGQESETSFLRKGVVGDWRNVLDEAGVKMIRDICGPIMPLRGYVG